MDIGRRLKTIGCPMPPSQKEQYTGKRKEAKDSMGGGSGSKEAKKSRGEVRTNDK